MNFTNCPVAHFGNTKLYLKLRKVVDFLKLKATDSCWLIVIRSYTSSFKIILILPNFKLFQYFLIQKNMQVIIITNNYNLWPFFDFLDDKCPPTFASKTLAEWQSVCGAVRCRGWRWGFREGCGRTRPKHPKAESIPQAVPPGSICIQFGKWCRKKRTSTEKLNGVRLSGVWWM